MVGGGDRAWSDDRAPRRRRSALRTPAFVDRMDLPDDAEGRVAIFTVATIAGEPLRGAGEPLPGEPRGGAFYRVLDRLGGLFGSPYAAVGVAATLVVILALGLVLLHR
jgi:hypothetical protein